MAELPSDCLPALPPGRAVTVSVPATSANLGPGFDAFGLALDWRDELTVRVLEAGVRVTVTGESADALPRDETHLVLRCVRAALADLGATAGGLGLLAHNTIPHGRGLGSSSAAIVAGLTAGWALVRPDQPLDRAWVVRLATDIEGHPDNVAAAAVGGLVLAFGDREDRVQVVSPPLHPDVSGRVFVPADRLATRLARGLLPDVVPHPEAAANAGRCGLLVYALGSDPGLLAEATADWLHQSYRAPAMPRSAALCARLRSEGYAAVISGAGPTVLVLGREEQLVSLDGTDRDGFVRRTVRPGPGAAVESVSP